MLLMFATAACTFTSCEKEEPEQNQEQSGEEQVTIIGTWKCVDSNGDFAVLTLNPNYTGSISVTIDPTRATVSMTEYFNWNTSDDSSANHWLDIIHTGGDRWFESSSMIYILAGNTLRLDGFTYTRVN